MTIDRFTSKELSSIARQLRNDFQIDAEDKINALIHQFKVEYEENKTNPTRIEKLHRTLSDQIEKIKNIVK